MIRPPAFLVAAVCLATVHGEPAPVFHADRLKAMETAVRTSVAAGRLPGAVLWLEHSGTTWHQVIGDRAIQPKRETLTEDTIYDAASLTKVIATTTAVMKLHERGKIGLEDPVSRHIPGFAGNGRDSITVRHLLTHHSGLPAGIASKDDWHGTDRAIELACALVPTGPPGTAYRYSDANFILLGKIVEIVSGVPLDTYCEREIFRPLGMRDTGFRRFDPAATPPPPTKDVIRIAPTTLQPDGTALRGIVHDPTSRRMGGVAGHAGLFLTAPDLAKFCRMLLNGGRSGKTRILRQTTLDLMTGVRSPDGSARRGFGWDIDSPHAGQRGGHFPIGGFGHTGWTGPSVWIDPFSNTFLIFLTNRNHPSENGSAGELRNQLATYAAEAVRDFNFLHVPGSLPPIPAAQPERRAPSEPRPVLNGIDVLARDGFDRLKGMKIGLVTNASGIDRNGRSTIDVLKAAPEVKLTALFSPEHGLRAESEAEKIPDSKDAATGLPVYSLYGDRKAPTAAQLAGLDALVFDIQDAGCRFYTYVSTLTHCMEAASATGIRMVVLDRANPIGSRVEGPVLTEPRSFVAIHEIPLRHGMTLGELALLIHAERKLAGKLSVIACEGGNPVTWFDLTGLPWRNPSPNLRNPTATLLYPGVGMLEFCKLSVGRGTDSPFEIIGAPYIDDLALAASLNRTAPAGIRFTPVRFTPKSSVFANTECRGVRLTVTDRDAVRAASLGLVLADTLHRLYPDKLGLDACLKLLGDRPTLDAIKAGTPVKRIEATWRSGLHRFEERRKPHLLYPRP